MKPPASPPDSPAGLRDTGPGALLEAVAQVAGRLLRARAIAIVQHGEAGRSQLRACHGLVAESESDVLLFDGRAAAPGAAVFIGNIHDLPGCAGQPVVIHNPWIRFYAGCRLPEADGERAGALHVFFESDPAWDDTGRRVLDDLATASAAIIEQERVEARLRRELGAMRDSERRMALALAGSNTGIWDRDIPNDRIYYSPGWKAMLGYAVSEIGDQLAESYTRVHPDDLAYVRATIQAHFEQKTPVYEVEHRLRCKDGSYKWVSSRGRVVRRDSGGRPLRMIGTTTDITVMRDMSERLRQTAELLTNLTDEVPGLVFQYQLLPDGRAGFPYASAGIREIYELEPQDVAATAGPLDAIIHADDLDAYYGSLEASARNLSPWHLEYRVVLPRQGLRWRQGDARPRRMEDGSILWHGFITDITERQAMEDELRESAMVDALTRLPNRRCFMRQIDAEHERIRRENGKSAAVLMCDLDHFKDINDRWGHATGDEALRHFAGILQAHLRKTDVAGRLGGEEFAIMLRATDLAEASGFARRLQGKMRQTPVQQNGSIIPITLSIGIAIMGAGDPDAESVLSRSDAALYKAKASGRDRIEQH